PPSSTLFPYTTLFRSILDLALPGMSGVEVIERMRSLPETRAVPVIVLSNNFLPGMVQAAWKAGATKCLSKADSTPRQMAEIVRKDRKSTRLNSSHLGI